jgi:hypothetical protein
MACDKMNFIRLACIRHKRGARTLWVHKSFEFSNLLSESQILFELGKSVEQCLAKLVLGKI